MVKKSCEGKKIENDGFLTDGGKSAMTTTLIMQRHYVWGSKNSHKSV